MGAVHKLDLTSDVTHLVVGNTDTPKYRYVAKERPDVKVVIAEWVEAVRDSWMQGGDTNVAALEEEYRVPTFFGLRICLTGFEDSECAFPYTQTFFITQRRLATYTFTLPGSLGMLKDIISHAKTGHHAKR